MPRTRALPLPLLPSSPSQAWPTSTNPSKAPLKHYNRSITNDPYSKYKSWKVTGLLPWSALLFTAGFIMRTIGAFGQWGNIGVYIASTVLLLGGP